jgi:hypothetical protein
MWCPASPAAGDQNGELLGVHPGMSGKIVITDGRGHEIDGGDYWDKGRAKGDYRYSRFSLTFADGGMLILVGPRRLGRVRLDPPVEALGPDAQTITTAQFRAAFARGTAPVKARLLDQDVIAGIGNLVPLQNLAGPVSWGLALSAEVGHDGGSCLSVCCTCSWSGSSAGWSCWAGARRRRTQRSWCYATR